jgi:hypothetical protein
MTLSWAAMKQTGAAMRLLLDLRVLWESDAESPRDLP